MRKILLFLMAAVLAGPTLWAQTTYLTNFVDNGGNPGGVRTQGDAGNTGASVILAGSAAANGWSSVYTLPFSFSFYGTAVTHLKASGNGVVTFDTTATAIPADANGNLPDALSNIPNQSILGFWDAFTGAAPTGSNDAVWVGVEGTAPNRQVWIKYHSYEYGNSGTSYVASYAYWAIVLEEGTNKVYVVDMVYHNGGASLTSTIGVQNNSTTAVQYGTSSIGMGAGSSGSADNDYYEFTPVLLVNDNAGIPSIDAPASPLTTGTQNVDVTLKNYGLNALTSATINWKVNGVTQTAYSYTGNLAKDSTASVTLGTYNFLPGTSTIEVWSSSPNGNTDNDTSNDSAMVSLCTSLSGAYTIGSTGADYTTIAAATADLNSCGVSGPVTFNIAAGTYSGEVVIGEIIGASATNTITFNGAGAATTTITYDGANTQNATIQLDGADYVTFKNLTIENTESTSYGWGVHLANAADYNTIDSCVINVDATSTASSFAGIISSNSNTSTASYGNNANYTTVSNTTINGGYYGVRFNGSSSSAQDNTNNMVMNCVFNDIRYYIIYFIYQDGPMIKGNTCNWRSGVTSGYGIYSNNSRHASVEENVVTGARTYGIYFTSNNTTTQNPTQRGLIANNMITAGGSGDGIYLSGSDQIDVFHNSVTAENDQALWINSSSNDYDVRNNIFVISGSTYVVDLDAAPDNTTDVLNNNIYYNSGTGSIAQVVSTNYSTLAAWQTGDTTQNANSLEGDPVFTAATDLHILGTLANDVGDNTVGITVDIDGDTRPASGSTIVDIGADEYTPASCSPPSGLTAFGVSNASAMITWVTGGAANWMVQYDTTGFSPGTGNFVSASNDTIMLSSLMAQTSYDVYVKDSCSASSTSPWVGPITFTTLCNPFTAPYTETFDGSSTPACWSQTAVSGGPWLFTGSTNSVNCTAASDHTGNSGSFAWMDHSGTDASVSLVMGVADVSALTTPYLEFYYWMCGTGYSPINKLFIDTWNGTTWVTADSIVTATAGWEKQGFDLSSFTYGTGLLQVRFRTESGGSSSDFYGDPAIDDVSIIEAPSCLTPSMLTALPATATSSVSFYFVGGGAADYNYEYGSAGFTPGSGTYVSTTNDTNTITGLSAATQLDVYVRDSCGAGNVSAWVGPLALSTLVCDTSSTCSFTANLTDSYGDGWNNGLVSFEIGGIEVGEVGSTFTSGSSATEMVSLCELDTVYVILKDAGSYPGEMGFEVLNPQGVSMFLHAATSGLSSGDTLGMFYSLCALPTCPIADTVIVADVTSCGPNPVTFMASGKTNPNTEYIWMRSDSAVLGYGEQFTTPPITATTDYYVGIFGIDDAQPKQHVGPLDTIATAGFGNFSNGQWFHADDFFYLDSISVKSNGLVTFQVRISEADPAGAGLELQRSDTIVVSTAGTHQVPVGLGIGPGNYFININFITAGTTGQLFRATSGAVYPYSIAGLVSIDSVNFGAITSGRYYYTYDWVVSEVCHGPIETATATLGIEPSTAFPYMVDFNTGQPCNWTSMADPAGADWMPSTGYGTGNSSLDSTAFMLIDDDAPGSSAITLASLMTPVINTQGYDTLFMEFDHYFRAIGNSIGYVEIYDGTAWMAIDSFSTTTGAWFAPVHEAYDITMYQNTDLQVRFRYDDGGTYAWYWALDNFEMDGVQTPCNNVIIDVLTDNWGSETTWSIVDTATGTVFASGGPYPDQTIAHYVDSVCLPTGDFFEFRINDSYGDGLFDGTNTGTYDVDIICPWGTNNVISGSGAFPYGSTTNPPSWDSVVFEVTCLVNCADPDSLMAMAECDEATVSWYSMPNTASSMIEYGVAGFTPGSGMTMTATSSPVVVQNLMQGTTYDVYVTDSCVFGTWSNMVGPYTFTTDTMPIAAFVAFQNASPHPDTVQFGFNALSTANADDLYWNYGDGSPLDTNGAFTDHNYGANGFYTVMLIATNDCGADTAEVIIEVKGIGLDEYGFGDIGLYPNPNDGFFTVSGITNFGDKALLEIINVNGAIVYRKEINASSSETVDIDMRGFPQGMYQVRVSNNKGVGVKPFILRN